MPRHKAAVNCAILPWLSANADCKEKKFLQIGCSIFGTDAFKELSSGAKWTYLCMSLEASGRRQFEFPAKTAKGYGIPVSSVRRYIDELIEMRFIACRSSGRFTRESNLYEFRFEWKLWKKQ